MADIKIKSPMKKGIKSLNKGIVGLEKVKDNLVTTKDKTSESISETGSDKIASSSQYLASKAMHTIPREIRKQTKKVANTVYKTKEKIKVVKEKQKFKNNFKKANKGIKTAKRGVKGSTKAAKNAVKVARETVKNTKRAIKVAKTTVKNTIKALKAAIKASIKAIKAIIAGTKALISAIAAGGWVAVVVIVVICLVGMICASIFGIFLSSEKTSSNAMTTKDVIVECNQEFSDKLQEIQDTNAHDEFVLDGSMAEWKDVLIIYAVKVSNGTNEQEVVTMNDQKKKLLKEIFWDMNEISHETREEKVTEQGVNTDESPKEVLKTVLHIKITSKTADEMKTKYNFSPKQMIQYNEITDNKYASLWNGVIYGSRASGEFDDWMQINSSWSNIKIGNTNSTIGQIGCLVTSIAILIEKSGVPTTIKPFNPGTFVEALNKNGGFDAKGNLQYDPINKIIPNFKYVGNINLRSKTREEKLSLIKQYHNAGYYITVEVKGATPGNQHWVAIIDVNSNNITIADPATSHTDLWSAYEYTRTSQFNYFQTK